MNPSPAHTSLPPILVVGDGRVGTTISRAASRVQIEVQLAGRDGLESAAAGAGVALLCVPDSEIESACGTVAGAAPELRFVGHTSGATSLDALAAARERGAATFSLHPLQTIPDGSADLLGAPAAVAGSDPEALAMARQLAEALGMRPFEVPEEARAAYHAAASIASNFLVTLEESAVELLRDAGIEDGRELLASLVLRSAANWAEAGEDALTGPIARGDEATVTRHLKAIAETSPELSDLYRALAERTQALAARRESVSA